MLKAHNPDWLLYGGIIVLLILGLTFCYSASSVVGMLTGVGQWHYIARQLAATAIGLIGLVALTRRDFRMWNTPTVAFIAMGSAIALVLLAGLLDGATHRWIRLPGFQLQPSEFAKPALVVFCAFFIAKRMAAINDRHTVLPASIVVGLLGALVSWGDLGTGVVMMATAATLFVIAGLRMRYIALAMVIAFCGAGVSVFAKEYRIVRVVGFFDPQLTLIERYSPDMAEKYRNLVQTKANDPHYQVTQSLVAVGSGGVTGRGLMESRQKFLFLPAIHTDFIYALIAEESGLIGAALILFLYVLVAWRGFRIYMRCNDNFGKYLALGITLMLVIQAFINISVVLAVAPTKGIPLPLVSYGGSAMIGALISLGMLMSVSERSA
jgi:cell division protein FtsW